MCYAVRSELWGNNDLVLESGMKIFWWLDLEICMIEVVICNS